MLDTTLVPNPAFLPAPSDPARAALGLERWRDQAQQSDDPGFARFALATADDPGGRTLLEAVFGNSPFLSGCLLAEPGIVRSLLADGAEAVFADLLRELGTGATTETDTTRLMRAMRLARRRVALTVALADITQAWPLERVTGALSDFAD